MGHQGEPVGCLNGHILSDHLAQVGRLAEQMLSLDVGYSLSDLGYGLAELLLMGS